MDRKQWKRDAKKNFKRNYWRSFAVCFIVTLLVGGTLLTVVRENRDFTLPETLPLHTIDGKSNSDIVNEFVNGVSNEQFSVRQTNGVIGSLFDNVSKSGSFVFGILNACNQFLFQDRIVAGIIIIIGVCISLLYWIFVSKVLEVGQCRFFLENRLYEKTKIGRFILPYRVRKSIPVSLAMLRKNIYQILWSFTIIGGPIKFYSYRMVPYLLAENPTLSGKQAISLSIQMTRGHKMELFLTDLSFIGYYILGALTFNLFHLFFTKPYHEATKAEYYMTLRALVMNQEEFFGVFCDFYLDHNEEGLFEYPENRYFLKQHESRNILKHLDYNRTYSLTSYILLFFAFSILGWLWEVSITLFGEGVFVNRGTLYGPWLPIYGSGGVIVLYFLRNVRDRPGLTFFLTMFFCGIIEYGTAFYLETFKHMRWWDYTGFFLNIQGRVCLEGVLFFGIGGLALIYVLAPYLDHIFSKWDPLFKKYLCVFLLFVIACDFACSSKSPNQGEGITTDIVQSSLIHLTNS